jgi:Transposase DDE domain
VKKTSNLYASLLDKFKKDCPDTHQTSLKNLLLVMSVIILKETVNLNKLKNQIGVILGNESTQSDSHYRRLTRFFDAPFHLKLLWKYLLKISVEALVLRLDQRGGHKYLLMDATSWNLGIIKFQFLFLCIVYEGISIPIFFVNLAKKGHSNFDERKRFLQMANILLPLKGMTLLADREYIGREWFAFLVNELSLNFVIRIPQGDYKTDLGYLYGQFIRDIKKGKTKAISIKIGENTFRLMGTKNRNPAGGVPQNAADDLLILMTNLPNNKHKIIAIYGIRWQIECMFKCLKSNGFNLEELGFTNPNKVRLMLCIVIACYVLCVCEGIKKIKKKTKKTKKDEKQKRCSIFQRGYEIINLKVQKIVLFLDWLLNSIFYKSKKFKPIF